ncbi:glutathione ABC transporter permease GsiD [Streptomyces coacervatus]|uniref:Glutathione ABC transporter permease GsiD n=1 Tax=Streptomyces coacervatus TaxID=647381 RepID=A0ABP7JMJ9_9ACTN|nr:ABC transporter permease [Streptomyces coacervatus]MDF2264354.1 ABC transporter permease [Streptomyces coacervatus]
MTATALTLPAEKPGWRGRVDILSAALGAVMVLLALAAVPAPLIAPYDPTATDILAANSGPSPTHWLGADDLGRDVLSRLLYGARLSLLGPTLIIATATVLGTALGIASAWLGGWFDAVTSRILDFFFAFPGLLLSVLAVAMIGTGFLAPVTALALAYTPYIARVTRTIAVRERNLAYVEALRSHGLGGWAICLRHLAPAVWPVIRAQSAIAFGSALVDLAAVSYLGLGVQPPSAEWGLMVAQGQSALLGGAPWQSLSAGVLIIFVVLAVNTIGERTGNTDTAGARA